MTLVSKVNVNYICLFDLNNLRPSQYFVSHVETVPPGLNQYLAEDNQLCLGLFARIPYYFYVGCSYIMIANDV